MNDAAEEIDVLGDIRGGGAKPWLTMLKEAERADQTYHDKCDAIEKLYADLKALADTKADREFQIFWANLGVLKPAIYSRSPVPVVTPRFKDRRALPRKASEILERALISDFEADDVHDTLLEARDDLALVARGVVWVRFGQRDGINVPIAEHVDRKDFRHQPARKWKEVGWVARRAWLTREEVRNRFGEIPTGMNFEKRALGSDDKDEGDKKAEIWELWSKTKRVVVWLCPDCEDILDAQEPWLDLKGFFPCPRPVYATLQRGTLTPVPDFVYYRDQVEEINELTARMSALSESLRMRGFYPAGSGEISEAIESAIKTMDDRAVLVPISSFAATGLGPGGFKDSIIWMPLVEVATVIKELVALRRQLIEDVYEITGLSDIMRGATEASETLGAQQLKAQYGSVRVKERQDEMTRLALDVTRMKAEILAEEVSLPDLLEMSQVDDVPTKADIRMQAQQMWAQASQQGPEAMQAVKQQLVELNEETVTQEKIAELFQSQRVRPFVLEIETDSTIQPDEMAEKERRVEYITAVGGFIGQAAPVVGQFPMLGTFFGEALKFLNSGFRAGREMEMAVDELVEKLEGLAPQQQEAQQAAQEQAMQAQQRADDREDAKVQAEVGLKGAQAQKAMIEAQQTAMGPAPAEPVSVDPLDVAKFQQQDRKLDLDELKLGLEALGKAADLDARKEQGNGGERR